jgi:hypothetical protein
MRGPSAPKTLQPVGDDLWVVANDVFALGVHFPGRMTVVRLSDGGLWLHSPVPIDDALAAELAALGPVRHLVGPNRFHHLHLAGARARYPEATLWASPGLEVKRADLPFEHVLGPEAPAEWQADLQQLHFAACPSMSETVFFHPRSGALIVTDLLMNVHRCQGLMSKLVYWAEGVYRRVGVPRLIALLSRDKARARADAARILGWAPTVLVMAHGDVVDTQAMAALSRAFGVFGRPQALPAGQAA